MKYLKYIGNFILVAAIGLLFAAFIAFDLSYINPGNWDGICRFFYTLYVAVFSAVLSLSSDDFPPEDVM